MDYRRKVLALLGDQDPLAVMERLVPSLRSVLARVPALLLTRREAEGKWSILEVVGHLADTELVYGYRLRMMLTLDGPRFNRFNQEGWTRRLHSSDDEPQAALSMLEALRRVHLRLLGRLSPEELLRSGFHDRRGEETVGLTIRLWAGHDLLHLAQIERIRTKIC